MNLSELKRQPASELIETAQEMGIDNIARSRKQDIIFSILKARAKKGEDIRKAPPILADRRRR